MKTYNMFTNEEDPFLEGKADFILAFTDESKEDAFASTPSLIMEAVNNLLAFSAKESLNLSYLKDLDAKNIVRKGMDFGHGYELRGNYLILAQSDLTQGVEREDIDGFEALESFSNKILLFYAGFLLEATRRFHVVLSGGVEMAVCLLIADKLRESVLMRIKHDNATLTTSRFSEFDKCGKIIEILAQLSYVPNAIYTDFSFANAEIETLQRYNEELIESAVNAGGALAYAAKRGLANQALLEAIELVIYES
jgi:hypothetical protein